MTKTEIINWFSSKNIQLNNTNSHFANIVLYKKNHGWWLNIPFPKFNSDLYLILNDEDNNKIVLITIYANTIINPEDIFRNKENTADIFIPKTSDRTYIDAQSNGSNYIFSNFEVYDFNNNKSSNTTYWLISSNPDEYDSINAFKNLSEVDWGNASNNHIDVGDIVYIYISKPEQRIAIKTEVTKSDFGVNELLDNDGQFNKSLDLRSREKYFRLKLIKFIDNDLLSLEKLNQNGINGRIQGKRKVEGQALDYILENEDEKGKDTKNDESTINNAFFGNGIFIEILDEIIEAQKVDLNITSYIQPYKPTVFKFLKETNPSQIHPILFYISTTKDLNRIEYIADIVGWEDKRELFTSNRDRLNELNQHVDLYQKSTGGIYRYSDTEKKSECVNLISIKNLRKLNIPFPSSRLIKVSNGIPYQHRTQSGGWSEVYQLSDIEAPKLEEEVEQELAKEIEFSKSLSYDARQKRLENADKRPKEIQIVSRGFKRNGDVITAVLERANGVCERCYCKAPFIRKSDNTPYLEVHHKTFLSDEGDDSVENAIAVCPNCHRELHFGV